MTNEEALKRATAIAKLGALEAQAAGAFSCITIVQVQDDQGVAAWSYSWKGQVMSVLALISLAQKFAIEECTGTGRKAE